MNMLYVGAGIGTAYLAYRKYKGKPLLPVSAADVMGDINSIAGRKTTPTGDMNVPSTESYTQGRSAAATLGDWTTGFFAGGKDLVKKAGDAVKTETISTMTNVVDGLSKAAFELPKTLGDWSATAIPAVKKAVNLAVISGGYTRDKVIEKIDIIKAQGERLHTMVSSAAGSAIDSTSKTLGDAYGTVTGTVSKAVTSMKTTLGDLFSW